MSIRTSMDKKTFLISEDVDCTETWYIELTEEGEKAYDKEVTEGASNKEINDWLESNTDLWEYFDLKDRWTDNARNFRLEEAL